MAIVMCQQFVKDRLKTPSTADFPFGEETATQSGEMWTVSGPVDAQNSFGAQIRSHYVCRTKPTPDGNSWTAVDVEVR